MAHGRKYKFVHDQKENTIYVQGYMNYQAVKDGKCDLLLGALMKTGKGFYLESSLSGGKKIITDLQFVNIEDHMSKLATSGIHGLMEKFQVECVGYNPKCNEAVVLDNHSNLYVYSDVLSDNLGGQISQDADVTVIGISADL